MYIRAGYPNKGSKSKSPFPILHLSVAVSQHGPSAQFVQPEECLLLEGQMLVVLVYIPDLDVRPVVQIHQRGRVACVGFLSVLTVNGTGRVSLVVDQDVESVDRMLVGVGYLGVDKVQSGVVDGQHSVVGKMEQVGVERFLVDGIDRVPLPLNVISGTEGLVAWMGLGQMKGSNAGWS